MGQLESAVERLLQRNAQLQEQCSRLTAKQEGWQQQRQHLRTEIERLLADLERLREQQT